MGVLTSLTTVTCENSIGAEASDMATVTAKAGSTSGNAPGAPENLDVTPSSSTDGNIELEWDAPSTGTTPTGYLVYAADSISGFFNKVFAERSLSVTGLQPGWHSFEVFACSGSESSPHCGPSASAMVQVYATFAEPSLTGFDQNYKIWGKAGTNDFFVAREEGLAGKPGVTGFYMLEDKDQDAAAYYKFMYPVTHEAAKAAGFTTQPNLALELIDANLDGHMDLMITGLESETLGRWDMLIFSGAVTGSFPAHRVEMDARFKKYFHEINEWYKSCDATFDDCSYFFDNAKEVRVPKANIFKAETGFATEEAALLKLNEIRTNSNYASHLCNVPVIVRCLVVPADSNPVTNDIASNRQVTYVASPTWYRPRTVRDFDDNPNLPNLFFIIGLLYRTTEKETAKDFSAFGTAFETSFSLSRFIEDGGIKLDSIEAMYLNMYLNDLFVSGRNEQIDILTMSLSDFESDDQATIRFDFLMGMIRRFAQDVDHTEDIVGDSELDAFVLEQIADFVPFLRAGYHERAFSVDLIDGELERVREIVGPNDHQASPQIIRGKTVAVFHVHPKSSIGLPTPNSNDPGLSEDEKLWAQEAEVNSFRFREADRNDMGSLLETECRELPGGQDHIVLTQVVVPNYYLSPGGAVRVLERTDDNFKVRTVSGSDYEGRKIESMTYNLRDNDGNYESFSVPKQEDFVAGESSPCNENQQQQQ